jgi:prolipoprotein diacylglyceryltransferase
MRVMKVKVKNEGIPDYGLFGFWYGTRRFNTEFTRDLHLSLS